MSNILLLNTFIVVSLAFFPHKAFAVKAGRYAPKEVIREDHVNEEKPDNIFKVGDELLKLPEVHSSLNFDSRNEIPDSEEDQHELRSTRFWGRLYVEGWPTAIQFMRGHFGGPAPEGPLPIVLADPEDACGPLRNPPEQLAGAMVLAKRGTCTFGQKARHVVETAAKALVYVNNDDMLDHPPAPDCHDLELSVQMISRDEGRVLWSHVAKSEEEARDGGGSGGGAPRGWLVPINCLKGEAATQAKKRGQETCLPCTTRDAEVVRSRTQGGVVHMDAGGAVQTFEYLQGKFGTALPSGSVDAVLADPADACGGLTNNSTVAGKAVVVQRGGCIFLDKAQAVLEAGGSMLVLVNQDVNPEGVPRGVQGLPSGLFRMGAEPRWKAVNVSIPVVTVTDVFGDEYQKQAAEATVQLSFSASEDVHEDTWTALSELREASRWPDSTGGQRNVYEKHLNLVEGWPERVQMLEACVERYTGIDLHKERDSVKQEL
mmetsp:Transcript_14143/g.20834  ORF Transcript_14143/g.20834 Transcript_14143/m.20834 type:complete len:487 (-) Transcript_14143:7-1467(-)